MRWWLCVALAAFGCKEKAPPPATNPASGSSVADATPIAIDAIAVVAADARDARCADACLFLVDAPLADARGIFERTCGDAWPYTETDCDGLLFARNCIYAARGNVFKKPEWKARFEARPWYKPDPAFAESQLSTVAMANIKTLKRGFEECGLPAVSDADKALVKAVLEQASETNDSMIEIDGVAKTSASNRIRHRHIVDETSFVYAKQPTKNERTIVVGNLYHAVGGGELDESLVVRMTFDAAGELRAIAVE
jgi:hypothetical protein